MRPSSTIRARRWPVAVALVCLLTGPAFAEHRGSTLVLEAHVGQRSAETAQALGPVLSELERLGYAATTQSVDALLKGRGPRPGQRDAGRTLADIKQLIVIGRSRFDVGKFADAEVSLRAALDLIRRNPALLALDTNNERVVYSAFVALSLTLSKLKRQDEATEIMLELLRRSAVPIPQAEYGPKAEELHRAAEKRAQDLGRGTLSVAVNDSRAMVFLDGQFRGVGQAAAGDLIAGLHHVFVQVPGTAGVQYAHTVRANQAERLEVDWNLETRVHIDDRRPWLGFSSEQERSKEAEYARSLARRLGQDDVILVELAQINGTSYVVGTLYRADGRPPVGAFAPANSDEGLLRSLARYLYDGTRAAGLRVLDPEDGGGASSALANAKERERPSKVLPGIVGGAGAAALAGTAIAFKVRGYDAARDHGSTDGRDPYVGIMLGSSLVVGGGVYGWLRAATPASRLSAGLLGAGTAALIAGATLLLVDQDPRPELPIQIRNTTLAGMVTGAAGVALTSAGIYLFLQERQGQQALEARRAWAPSVLLGPAKGIAIAGQF